MTDAVMPSTGTPFGERLASRLRDEIVVWLTTVGADGTPHPTPVWFLWDGESFLVYSLANAARLRNIKRSPRVSLNFDGNGRGGDIAVITGEAREAPEEPPAYDNPAYCEKYGQHMTRSFGGAREFAEQYSVPVRIVPLKVLGG